MGDIGSELEPITPATPMENVDFEEEYYNLHIHKIFGEPGSTFVLPYQSDYDYSTSGNWTTEKILQECCSEYVSTFASRVEVFGRANRIPVFPENLLQEIHQDAQKYSYDLFDFIYQFRGTTNENTKHQLDVCLEKFMDLIKARNAARQTELLESVKESEKVRFVNCLKQRYSLLYDNQSQPNQNAGKFYDQAQLSSFVERKKKESSQRFKALLANIFIFVKNDQPSNDTIATIQKAAIDDTNQWMAQEALAFTKKNEKNETRVNAKMEKVILKVKSFLDNLGKTVDSLYFDDLRKGIKIQLQISKQEIEKIAMYAAVQSYKQIIEKYQTEAENLCEEYIYTVKVFRIATYLEGAAPEIQKVLSKHAEKTKVTNELLGDPFPKVITFLKNHLESQIDSAEAVSECDSNLGSQTPGSDIRMATPKYESGCDSDSTVLLDHTLDSKRSLKRNHSSSDQKEQVKESPSKKAKTRRGSH